MSELNEEILKQRIEAALNAEINRLWREAKGAPAATAVRYDAIAKTVQLHITFAEETSDTEATASVQRFLKFFEDIGSPLKAYVTTKNKRPKIAPGANPTKPKPLNEAIGFAKPATLELIRLVPMIREGLHSLQTRYTKAIDECARLSSLQIVSHDLGAITKALIEIKDVLDGLQELIEHFIIFDASTVIPYGELFAETFAAQYGPGDGNYGAPQVDGYLNSIVYATPPSFVCSRKWIAYFTQYATPPTAASNFFPAGANCPTS
jgi:hypothetical protein